MILQENINYPPPKMGIKMPLIRYIEGAISAEHPDILTLEEVISRTNNHNGPPHKAFKNNTIKKYLDRNIRAIK